jgi:hypothetical protein
LGLYKFGIVGWSAGDECVGERGSLVTVWGRMGGECVGRGREWMRRSRKSSGERALDFSTGEGGRMNGVRAGMRR